MWVANVKRLRYGIALVGIGEYAPVHASGVPNITRSRGCHIVENGHEASRAVISRHGGRT